MLRRVVLIWLLAVMPAYAASSGHSCETGGIAVARGNVVTVVDDVSANVSSTVVSGNLQRLSWNSTCSAIAVLADGQVWVRSLENPLKRLELPGVAMEYRWNLDGSQLAINVRRPACDIVKSDLEPTDVFIVHLTSLSVEGLSADCHTWADAWSDATHVLALRSVCNGEGLCTRMEVLEVATDSRNVETILSGAQTTSLNLRDIRILTWRRSASTLTAWHMLTEIGGRGEVVGIDVSRTKTKWQVECDDPEVDNHPGVICYQRVWDSHSDANVEQPLIIEEDGHVDSWVGVAPEEPAMSVDGQRAAWSLKGRGGTLSRIVIKRKSKGVSEYEFATTARIVQYSWRPDDSLVVMVVDHSAATGQTLQVYLLPVEQPRRLVQEVALQGSYERHGWLRLAGWE